MRIIITILLTVVFVQLKGQGNHWLQTFGTIQSERPAVLKVDANDVVLVTGTVGDSAVINFNNTSVITSSTNGNSFIYKQDSLNNLIWFNQIGGSSGSLRISDIEIDLNGNIYLAGDFRGNVDFDPSSQNAILISNSNSSDVFLAKYNSLGSLIWVKGFGGNNWDNGNDILLEDTSNVYLAGFFRGIVDFNPGPDTNLILGFAGPDGFISKFNSNGEYRFAYRIGGGGWDDVKRIMFNSNHDLIAVGSFQATAVMNPRTLFTNRITSGGGSDLFILRLDTAGYYISAKRIGGAGTVGVSDAVVDNDTLYLIGGIGSGSSWLSNGNVDFNPNGGVSNYASTGNEDSYLVKLDPTDNPIWLNQFGGSVVQRILGFKKAPNGEIVVSVAITDTTKIYVNGVVADSVFSQNNESIIVKLNANGSIKWLKQFNSDLSIYLNCVDIDSRGNIYSLGSFQGRTDFNPTRTSFYKSPIGQDDIFVMKNFAGLTTIIPTIQLRENNFKVFPNPSEGKVTVKANNAETVEVLSVRDANGRKVEMTAVRIDSGTIELTIQAKSGMYFVEVNSNGLGRFVKVLKQ